MPPDNLLTPADRSRRRIRPTTFKDCSYDNTITRQEIRNSCGLKIPGSKTEQYKNSFFIRTVADWNKLEVEDTVVTVDSVTAFSSAVGRVLQGAAPHTQAIRAKMRCMAESWAHRLSLCLACLCSLTEQTGATRFLVH